jgi:hypothetical protein
LSDPRTGRFYPPENISGTHFCQRLSRPQGHSAARRIMSMKNSNCTIGNRTRELPTCSLNQLRHREKMAVIFWKYVRGRSLWLLCPDAHKDLLRLCLQHPPGRHATAAGARSTSEGRLLKYWYRHMRLIKINTTMSQLDTTGIFVLPQ